MRRIILAAALCASAFSQLAAQGLQRQVDRTATVVVQPFLTCVGTKNIDFGSHLRSEGVLSTSGTNYLEVTCQTDPANLVNVGFLLPANLTNPVATGFPIPITYGTISGMVQDGTSQRFDPHTGALGYDVASGNLTVTLGKVEGGGGDQAVSVDVSAAKIGTYSGTITVFVAVP